MVKETVEGPFCNASSLFVIINETGKKAFTASTPAQAQLVAEALNLSYRLGYHRGRDTGTQLTSPGSHSRLHG